MRNSVFVLLFVLVAALSCTQAMAESVYNGLKYEIVSGNLRITGYTEDCPVNLVVPERIGADAVYEIANGCFQNFNTLKSVQLPSSLIRLGSTSFTGCVELESLSVYEASFSVSNDHKYTSVDGVLYSNSGSELAVFPAKKQGRFEISDGVTTIWKGAFDSSNLTYLVIPGSITNLKDETFKNSKIRNIEFTSDMAPTIGNDVFMGCMYVRIRVPYGCKSEYEGFGNVMEIYYEDGIQYSIRNSEVDVVGFSSDCSNNVVLPRSIEISGASYTVKNMADSCFIYCDKLEEITIPSSYVRIGTMCFAGCSSLRNIYIDGDDGKYTSVDGVLYAHGGSGLQLAVMPAKKTGTYVMPDELTDIWKGAFWGSSLSKVVVNENISTIKDETFKNCENLRTVEFTSTEAPTFQKDVFAGCSDIKIVVPDGSADEYKEALVNNAVYNTLVESSSTAVPSVGITKNRSVVKTIENGKVVIIRDNKKYDLSGCKL
ncbi:MAG: leucine-rich repeat domain-containing protein [Bacteroidales bacterium]|nr:leucine-rich repeat domain-containing protein [Bacteroidales bacterium]